MVMGYGLRLVTEQTQLQQVRMELIGLDVAKVFLLMDSMWFMITIYGLQLLVL